MWNILELVISCILLWLYLQTAWIFFVNFLYLTVPWLVWGAVVVLLLIRFGARVPSPSNKVVESILGRDLQNVSEYEDGIIKKAESESENENENKEFYLRVVAHRGAGFDYPENSMSAFRNSHKRGCDGIEFDLAMTKDNIPIIFHDVTIDRLTGLNGTIKDMTWDELKDCDISTTHPLRSKFDQKSEKIALFEEVLEEHLKRDWRLFIDIKATGKEVVKVILNAYKKHPEMYKKAVITSFNPIVIYMIRRRDPQIVAGMAYRPQFYSMQYYNGLKGPHQARTTNIFRHLIAMLIDAFHDWAFERVTYYVLGLSFVLLQKDLVSPEVIRQWKERGVRVIAWTVNLPTEKVHFTRNLRVSYLTDTLLS